MFLEQLKDKTYMLGVLLEIVGVYKDVVKVDNTELIEVRMEDVIDVGLEGSRGSGKTYDPPHALPHDPPVPLDPPHDPPYVWDKGHF